MRDEKYAWLGALPRVREWIGDRQFEIACERPTSRSSTSTGNRPLEVPRTAVDDDRLGTLEAHAAGARSGGGHAS